MILPEMVKRALKTIENALDAVDEIVTDKENYNFTDNVQILIEKFREHNGV